MNASYPLTQQQAYVPPLNRLRPLSNPSTPALNNAGVNVHFFTIKEGYPLTTERDLDAIQQAGFHHVRMDLLWNQVEKEPGKFDFKAYDDVIRGLLKRGIQPMIILGLGNPLYGEDISIKDPKAALGFERYAKQTVQHYQGFGLLYELVNEPNHPLFWKPEPNVSEYMNLAKDLLPKLRNLDPSARFVAPSTAGAPRDYLERCFQKGLLQDVDAVTIHPYQTFYKEEPKVRPPEAFEKELRQTRTLIDCYAPRGKHILIILGEWGYSSIPKEVDEKTQANYLVRQFLLGALYGSPVNIWYDWRGSSDGAYVPGDKESNFGLVRNDGPSSPKPAYFAMRELSLVLNGKCFAGRFPGQEGDYLLRFSDKTGKTILASWTSGTAHTVMLGKKSVMLTGKPSYTELYRDL